MIHNHIPIPIVPTSTGKTIPPASSRNSSRPPYRLRYKDLLYIPDYLFDSPEVFNQYGDVFFLLTEQRESNSIPLSCCLFPFLRYSHIHATNCYDSIHLLSRRNTARCFSFLFKYHLGSKNGLETEKKSFTTVKRES